MNMMGKVFSIRLNKLIGISGKNTSLTLERESEWLENKSGSGYVQLAEQIIKYAAACKNRVKFSK